MNILVDPRNSNRECTQLDLYLDEWQQSVCRWPDHLKTNQKESFLPWKHLFLRLETSRVLQAHWRERTLWEYTNLWTMAEAYPESLERKKLEQRTTKMMDEHIGQAVRQYTPQAPSSSKQNNFYKPTVAQAQDKGNTSQNLVAYPSQTMAGNSSYSFQDRCRLM
jgi:hypothetical protein